MLTFDPENIDNWVFVTGVIRSGTTFVGKILSTPLQVDYIHEPFNTGCGMPGMKRRYEYVRPSLDTDEMERIHSLTQKIFQYDFTLKTSSYSDDPWYKKIGKKIVGSRGPFYLFLAKMNPFHQAAIIKDPTGSMLTEYLYSHFDIQPVIIVRHPVSLTASFRRLQWWPQSRKLLNQSHLTADHFTEQEIKRLRRHSNDNELADAAAHWYLVNKVLLTWADKHSWLVVRHEDLCETPLSTFRQMYDHLNLPWSNSVSSRIERLTQNDQSAEAKNGAVQDFNRDSASIFEMRRDSIPVNKRRKIYEITKDVALELYPKSSFALE